MKDYTIYFDWKNKWWVLSNYKTRIKGFKTFDDAFVFLSTV